MYFDRGKLVTFNCTHFVSLTHPSLILVPFLHFIFMLRMDFQKTYKHYNNLGLNYSCDFAISIIPSVTQSEVTQDELQLFLFSHPPCNHHQNWPEPLSFLNCLSLSHSFQSGLLSQLVSFPLVVSNSFYDERSVRKETVVMTSLGNA